MPLKSNVLMLHPAQLPPTNRSLLLKLNAILTWLFGLKKKKKRFEVAAHVL